MVNLDLEKMESMILKELEPEIIDLNVSQLASGEGFSGSKLPEYANANYYAAKSAEGLTEKAGKHYNILFTGSTRELMITKQIGQDTIITSTDVKTPRLNLLTDNDIFGLQDKNMKELDKLAIPKSDKALKKYYKI